MPLTALAEAPSSTTIDTCLVRQSPRRVAVLGGNRIPFARSNSVYADASNQDMLTAAIDGLVVRFGLEGERLGEVVAGAVLKHSRDFNLTRESVLGSRLAPETPATTSSRRAAPVSRRRSRSPTRSRSARSRPASPAAPTPPPTPRSRSTSKLRKMLLEVNRARDTPGPADRARADPARRHRPDDPAERRAAHRPVDGRARRAHRAGVEHRPRGAGRARGRLPPAPRGGVRRAASSTTW